MNFIALRDGYDFISEENLLYELLRARGIKDPKTFLNVNESHVHDGLLLRNMSEGLEMLHNHIVNGSRIHVQVDSDSDGNASSCIIIKYIKHINPKIKITYTLHEGKQHGINLALLKKYEFDLLIVPDAGSSDVEQSRMLKEQGKDILIIDHHEFEVKDNPYALVVNCMDGQYPNQTLSGSAMTYKFCKEYDKMFGYNYADRFLDLVALGNISDSMDLSNYETRYLTLKGLKQMGEKGNTFINEIIKRNEYSIQGEVDIKAVGWSIAPYINGNIRSGTMEEKLDMFKALLEENETREYKPRKSKNNPEPKVLQQSLQEFMARVIANVKARQDREVKKGVEKIIKKIEEDGLDKDKILIVDAGDILDSSYTGLVANKLASQYKRPVLLLRKYNNKTYGGSGRNYNLSPIVDLKKFLEELETFNYVAGHSNAFGFNIEKDKIYETRDKANELLKDIELSDTWKVDYEIPIGRLKPHHIKEVGNWADIWGGGLEEPLFAITNIFIPTDKIQLTGSRANFIKFESRGITFIKKFTNEEEYNKMIMKQTRGLSKKKVKSVKMDVIGKFVINKYNDSEYEQIEIVDYQSTEGSDFIF